MKTARGWESSPSFWNRWPHPLSHEYSTPPPPLNYQQGQLISLFTAMERRMWAPITEVNNKNTFFPDQSDQERNPCWAGQRPLSPGVPSVSAHGEPPQAPGSPIRRAEARRTGQLALSAGLSPVTSRSLLINTQDSDPQIKLRTAKGQRGFQKVANHTQLCPKLKAKRDSGE